MSTNGAPPKYPTEEHRYSYIRSDNGGLVIKTRTDYSDKTKSFTWPKGERPSNMLLYNHDLLEEHRHKRPDEWVFLGEGEKTADAFTRCGLTGVSLAGSGTQRNFGTALDALAGLRVVLCPDRQDGEGLMREVTTALTGTVAALRWVDMPPEVKKQGRFDKGTDFGDLVEHVSGDERAARMWMLDLVKHAVDPSVARPATAVDKKATERLYPQFEDFNDLADEPEEEMAAFGLFTEGTWIIAGAPKLGKSWFCLSYAHGLAMGGAVLGAVQVEQADVLAFVLEDGRRRYKQRIKRRVESLPRPPRGVYQIVFSWPRLDESSMNMIESLVAVRTAAGRRVCLVIDTGTKLRPLDDSNRNIYMGDYNFLDPITQIAQRYHCLILVVAHTRKAPSEDFIDSVIGSHGISGAVDGIAVLSRQRHSKMATLEWTSRDGDEEKRTLKWDTLSDGWLITDEPDTASESRKATEALVTQARTCIMNNPGTDTMSLRELVLVLKRRRADVMEALSLGVEWGMLDAEGSGAKNDPVRYSVPGTDSEPGTECSQVRRSTTVMIIRVFYPSGRQMLVPVSKWHGLLRMTATDQTVVVDTIGVETMALDPRAVIINEETGEWVYGPRDGQRLRGEMGQWLREHEQWGWEVPPKHATPLRYEDVIKNAKSVNEDR